MSSKDQLVLKKIQQHIESILRYCQGVRNFQQFQSDSMLVEATVFNLMQIGELAKVSLSDEAKAQLTAIHGRSCMACATALCTGMRASI